MTSTPAPSSSSAIFGVIPRPPATFSPLTTTKVGAWRSRRAGSRPRSVRRPSPPTRSPTRRMVAGASGTAHTLAHGPNERTAGHRRPAARGAAARRDRGASRAPRGPARRRAAVVQLVSVLLAGFALYAVAKAAGPVLLLFLTAAIIALILNPVVTAVQGGRVPRGVAILFVYLAFFATLAAIGTLLSNPI